MKNSYLIVMKWLNFKALIDNFTCDDCIKKLHTKMVNMLAPIPKNESKKLVIEYPAGRVQWFRIGCWSRHPLITSELVGQSSWNFCQRQPLPSGYHGTNFSSLNKFLTDWWPSWIKKFRSAYGHPFNFWTISLCLSTYRLTTTT